MNDINPEEIICGICLNICLIPCMIIHDIKSNSACREFFCEECINKCLRCPLCNGKKINYRICIWKIDLKKNVNCNHCKWNGTSQQYLTNHVLLHL